MDFFLNNSQTFLLEKVLHYPGGFVRCIGRQCKKALVGVRAVRRMGWKLAASLFIYALAKQNRQLRWLASTGQLLYKIR